MLRRYVPSDINYSFATCGLIVERFRPSMNEGSNYLTGVWKRFSDMEINLTNSRQPSVLSHLFGRLDVRGPECVRLVHLLRFPLATFGPLLR